MSRRIAAVCMHLAWTVPACYVILGLIQFGVIGGLELFKGAEPELVDPATRVGWFVMLWVLDPVVCAAAGIFTTRGAMRTLRVEQREAPAALAPPLLVILIVTGIPALVICAVLVLAAFIGFLLALFLLPYFLVIAFALLYLLWLKVTAAVPGT